MNKMDANIHANIRKYCGYYNKKNINAFPLQLDGIWLFTVIGMILFTGYITIY